MFGVATPHILGDVAPAAGPEAREILGSLDWPPGGRGNREHQWDLAFRDHWVLRQAEQSLRADLDRGAGLRRVIDRVSAFCGAGKVSRREAIELSHGFVAEQAFKGARQPSNIAQAPLAVEER